MQERYSALYLAPHLDDVALSCGGQIAQRTRDGERVLVATVTAGDPSAENLPPFAQAHHEAWNLSAEMVVRNRRAEDARAAAILGAEYVHLPLLDAIYRVDSAGAALYESDETLFGEVASVEDSLVDEIVAMLRKLPAADQVVAPLTVGGHVDHRLTRLAAERAFDSLLYYEDYPYAQRNGLEAGYISKFEATTLLLSDEAIETKIAAIEAYESQVDHLFEDIDDMRGKVRDYVQQVGGERLWKKRK